MKLMGARVGSLRGWILVAGLGVMLPAVALVGGSKGLAKTPPALGLAPAVAQQSSASQIDASPLMKWIESVAQAPRLRIIKERLAPLAPALAPSAPPLMLLAPVSITKDASPISGSSVTQGQVIAYTLQATNGASSDTTTGAGGFVRIVDTAPSGTLFTNVIVQQQPQFGSAWSCSILGGGTSIECHAGDGTGAGVDTFTTQEFVKIRAEVTVQASTLNGSTLTNTATYQFDNNGTGLDGTATSNSVFHVVNSSSADLAVTKTAETLAGSIFGASVTAGGTIAGTLPSPVTGTGEILYTITYSNNGLGDATNVHVRDDIPAGTLIDPTFLPIGVVVTPASGPSLTCQILPTLTNYQLDCTPNSANSFLPAGANGTIQFRVRVPENTLDGTVIKNKATINSELIGSTPGTPDPNGGNNTSNETQNIVRTLADLAITKSGPATVIAGNTITYTLTVTNNGPSDAQNVVVKDTLPPNVSFVSTSSTDNQFICTPDNGNAGVVNCASSALIAPAVNPPPIIPPRSGSNTATITIVGRVNAGLANGTILSNSATVSATTGDPVAANNAVGPINTTVTNDASLSITKTGPGTACPGDAFTYHLTVNNGGISTAQGVTISDPLPPNTTFLSVSGTGGLANACSHNGGSPGTVTCFGDLPSGQSTADIRLALAAGAPNGDLSNTATITNSGTGTIAVGTSTAHTTVGCSTVLSISPVTVTEGTGGTTSATFTVTLAAASTQTVSVDFVSSDGTASNLADYTAQAGTLTFAPGVTTRNIVVPIITDSLPEPTETFQVTLFNPNNATIGTAQATGTINDDDASGVFQFSATTANVNENAVPGSINLTINRTGDTSGVASVNFETNDITALQKSDYTFNSGNVQFGPGVTSKTVNVLIVNDALVEGPETFWVSLSNASGNFVISGNSSIAVTINDDDVVPGANPIDSAVFFVRQQYLDFLGREPDASGLAFWSNQITLCGADPACILDRRVNVSGAFFLSIEFQETSGNVIRSQRVAFARQSGDPATRISYLQFMRDTRQVGAGVIVGQPGYAAVLEANKQAYAQQIVSSPAFNARFPISPAATYVDALYASAGVTPTAAERTAAINAFGAGATPGRIAAFRSVADSASVRTAEFQTSFVLAEYFGYLRRNPTDAPDFNDAGYQFWLTKLNLFNGDFQKAEMVRAFITSFEYRGRFGTP